jgi:hypothetical protein
MVTCAALAFAVSVATSAVRPPVIQVVRESPTLRLHESTVLRLRLSNRNTVSITGFAFKSVLSSGLVIAKDPTDSKIGCKGKVTASSASNVVLFEDISMPAGSACEIGVDIVGIDLGLQTIVTSDPTGTCLLPAW